MNYRETLEKCSSSPVEWEKTANDYDPEGSYAPTAPGHYLGATGVETSNSQGIGPDPVQPMAGARNVAIGQNTPVKRSYY